MNYKDCVGQVRTVLDDQTVDLSPLNIRVSGKINPGRFAEFGEKLVIIDFVKVINEDPRFSGWRISHRNAFILLDERGNICWDKVHTILNHTDVCF